MKKRIEEIEKFREEIDIIDQTILELIGKRYAISGRIGEVKRNLNLDVLNKEREKELLSNIKIKARKLNLDEKLIEDVWVRIIKESRRVQKNRSTAVGK
jgi:chorismate mutase